MGVLPSPCQPAGKGTERRSLELPPPRVAEMRRPVEGRQGCLQAQESRTLSASGRSGDPAEPSPVAQRDLPPHGKDPTHLPRSRLPSASHQLRCEEAADS